MMKHLNAVVDGHNWFCHPPKDHQLLGMKPLSCDNGDVEQSLMLMAQPDEALEPGPVSLQTRHSPGTHFAFLYLLSWTRSFSAPPPGRTVALGDSDPYSVFLFAVLQVSPPWKQLLSQHPEIYVGGFFPSYI